ncbi:hypothetical protein Tco_1476385 [Tanacetum coccineum]
MDEGTKNYLFDHIFEGSNPSVLVDKTKSAGDRLKTAHTDSGVHDEFKADDISLKVKLEDLLDILKDTRSALFTPDSPRDEPINILDESKEEEEVAKYKDIEPTSYDKEELEQADIKAEAEVATMKAKPSYPDINQLIELLITSLKPKLSKLLASHDFASCLPTKLKELPSKITRLFGEIQELKKHIRYMEIELPGDLKEIPTKLETFTSTISSLSSQVAKLKNIQWELPVEFLNFPCQVSSVQEKLKTLDSLPSILHKVTDTLNRFANMVDNALEARSMNVPSAGKATASPAEGEKNTKDAGTNLKDELVDLLGKNVVTQYYTKKLLFDKYWGDCWVQFLSLSVGIKRLHDDLEVTAAKNGNAPPITKVIEGVETIIALTTSEEKAQRRLELKATSTLLMGIPNEHQLKFNSIKDANQLKIHGESISQEDVNQKFLRSLSLEWNTHTIVWRNKPEIDTLSMDDLYNNPRIYELEVKGTLSSSTNTQNVAFVSANSNTNGAVNTIYGAITTSTQATAVNSTTIDNLSDAVICAFFASQPNNP